MTVTKLKDLYKATTISKAFVDIYYDYITGVSSPVMAASFESCEYLFNLCTELNIKSVLDLGSGFSSFTFRHHKKLYRGPETIWSVDSSQEWLAKSSEFSLNHGVDTSDFIWWDDVINKHYDFDLIFIDIASSKARPSYFKTIFENFVTPKSIVIFDDMHKPHLTKDITKFMSQFSFKTKNIKKDTIERLRGKRIRFCSYYYDIERKVSS